MNGEVSLTVTTSQVRFELKFDRNISVIQGDSGTGKSLICTLLNESQLPNSGISVKINKDIPVVVMPDITLNSPVARPWYEIIKNSSDTLFFIDETCDCLAGKPFGFAQCIKSTSNYYVIFSRKRYPDLPYSIHSLYTLNKETMELKPAIIRNIHCYINSSATFVPEYCITEDSGAGYLFFNNLVNCEVISARSKTRIAKCLSVSQRLGKNNILIIADGAAFGPEWPLIQNIISSSISEITVFLPESFEWFLLHSLCFKCFEETQYILDNFLTLIDYTKYFSVEQYFTDVLKQFSMKVGCRYYKEAMPDKIFLTKENTDYLRKLLFKFISQGLCSRNNSEDIHTQLFDDN